MKLALTRALYLAALSGLAPGTGASSVSVKLPSSVPSYNIVQDNFVGISFEFNVLNYLSTSLIPPSMTSYSVPGS